MFMLQLNTVKIYYQRIRLMNQISTFSITNTGFTSETDDIRLYVPCIHYKALS